MCLYYDEDTTKKFRSQIRKCGGTITAYKVVYVAKYKARPSIHSVYRTYRWKRGLNISSRKTKKLSWTECQLKQIHEGFHVYLKPPVSSLCCPEDMVIMPVQCHLQDLVGCSRGVAPEAVFTQVTLSRKEFDKARQ